MTWRGSWVMQREQFLICPLYLSSAMPFNNSATLVVDKLAPYSSEIAPELQTIAMLLLYF